MQNFDPERAWDYENGYFLTCKVQRISKLITHYELFKRIVEVPGAIVECGVFKGASFCHFAQLRALLSCTHSKTLVGFDTFGDFPETKFDPDIPFREHFVQDAGSKSISKERLLSHLEHKECQGNVKLVAGDICQTVPKFCEENPQFRISLLNLDVDIYEPSKVILEHLYPRLVPGGVLLLDDYGVFPGETKAIEDYFSDKPKVRIQKLPHSCTPAFIVKPGHPSAEKGI